MVQISLPGSFWCIFLSWTTAQVAVLPRSWGWLAGLMTLTWAPRKAWSVIIWYEILVSGCPGPAAAADLALALADSLDFLSFFWTALAPVAFGTMVLERLPGVPAASSFLLDASAQARL